MMYAPPRPHFYMLDVLRGLASLSVVFWHYKMFYTTAPSILPPTFDKTQQPLYSLFWPLYDSGFEAVTVFFVLSGFVIFLVYFDDARARRIGGSEYALHRFSRLYPLHFATLLVVTLGQILAWLLGTPMGHPFNDIYHFVLNLFLASNWGLQSGYSFNGPIWSVSVEVLLYAAFFLCVFILTPTSRKRTAGIMLFAAVAICASYPLVVGTISHAVVSFLVGGLAYFAWSALAHLPPHQLRTIAAVGAVAALFFAIALISRVSWAYVVVFPLIILSLATLQTAHRSLGYSFRIVGDITYSTYLLHFPIQLFTMLTTTAFSVHIDYDHPAVLATFLAVVIAASVPTYHYFEVPMKNWLRRASLPVGHHSKKAATTPD